MLSKSCKNCDEVYLAVYWILIPSVCEIHTVP